MVQTWMTFTDIMFKKFTRVHNSWFQMYKVSKIAKTNVWQIHQRLVSVVWREYRLGKTAFWGTVYLHRVCLCKKIIKLASKTVYLTIWSYTSVKCFEKISNIFFKKGLTYELFAKELLKTNSYSEVTWEFVYLTLHQNLTSLQFLYNKKQ